MLPVEAPGGLDRPALSRLTVSSPELPKPFRELNAGKAWPDQIKPYNFLLVGHVRPFGHPVGVDPTRIQPIAPYESDLAKWTELPWIDRYSGERYRVALPGECDDPEAMQLQTYRDVVREFRTHPEAKSADADGAVCSRRTVGLLRRRVVRETVVAHVGKEANKLEEVEAGLEHDVTRSTPRASTRRATRGGRRCCRCCGSCPNESLPRRLDCRCGGYGMC